MKLMILCSLLTLGAFGTETVRPNNSTILMPTLNDTQLGPTLPPSPWDDCGWGPGTDCK